jgi:hypothetical protein
MRSRDDEPGTRRSDSWDDPVSQPRPRPERPRYPRAPRPMPHQDHLAVQVLVAMFPPSIRAAAERELLLTLRRIHVRYNVALPGYLAALEEESEDGGGG